MKRLKRTKIQFLYLLVAIALFAACQEFGQKYTSFRNITSYTMINIHGAYMKMSAKPDSVFPEIFSAKVQGTLFRINDSVDIMYVGHCWSVTDEPYIITGDTNYFYSMHQAVNYSDSVDVYNFASYLTDLQPDSTYYVRSFAIIKNKATGKVDTAYNSVVTEFHTLLPSDIWFEQGSFDGDPRTQAVVFILNNEKIYVGSGYNGITTVADFFTYDPNTDSWAQTADIPAPTYRAFAFALNDTGYVGGGLKYYRTTNDEVQSTDVIKYLYRYSNGIWGTDCELSTATYDAVGFTAYSRSYERWFGYMGMGRNSSGQTMSNFTAYDFTAPDTLRWRDAGQFIKSVAEAVAVNIGADQVVIGSGVDENGNYLKDFYQYTFDWVSVGSPRALTGLSDSVPGRADAVGAFLDLGEKKYFYFGTGYNSQGYLRDWYAFDFLAGDGQWKKLSDIKENDKYLGEKRRGAIAFPVAKKNVNFGSSKRIFVGLGRGESGLLKDVWEYLP